MRRLLLLLLALGLVLVACGSGDDLQPGATGTATSERAARDATVAQQRQQSQDQVQPGRTAIEAQDSAGAAQTQAADDSAPVDQVDQIATDAEAEDSQADVLPIEIVGEHKGVRSVRNVLGAPAALVEIRYYGDFT